MTKDKNTRKFLLGNYYAFLVTGMMVLMLGAVMPYLLEENKLRYDQGGTLLMLQAAGNLVASMFGGIISTYTGKRPVMVFGALTFVAGYGGVALVSSTAAIYILLTVSGLGWGILNSLVNVVVSEKVKGDARYINILHMAFGVGALGGPLLVSLAVKAGLGWQAAMLALAFFALILVVVFLRMDLPDSTVTSANKKSQPSGNRISFTFLKDIRFYIFMLILFFYVGSESGVNGWLTSYILDSGISDEFFAQRLLSVTWFAVIIGRLACAWLSKYLSKEALLLAGGLGSFLFVNLLIFSNSSIAVSLSVIGLGLSFAGIYPNTVANAGYLLQSSSAASGIIFSCGGLGASFIPYIVGLRAESKGIAAGLSILVITLLILALLCISNLLVAKTKSRGRISI